MARFLVVTHEFDSFATRERFWKPRTSDYLLFHALEVLNAMGHTWRVSAGRRRECADAAILHVDATRVSEEYLALADHYPVAINFGASDISKRRIGSGLLSRGEPWDGPVIVKSDLNFGGWPEAAINAGAAARGRPLPFPEIPVVNRYPILERVGDVPEEVWSDPNMVVQRFLPEIDPEGYALRTWVFAGPRGRCTRHVSTDPIVKADRVVNRRPVEVPPELIVERERLGFDFGKFDFVMRDGRAILLDANRTPGMSPNLAQYIKEGIRNIAEGLAAFVGH
jgi:hypothetical protein